MAWRGVHISQPARLNFRDNQLIVAQEDGEVSLAIEDIVWLILDTPQVSVTGTLLSALAEAGVAMIVPDGRHHPAGVLLSFHQHHAQAHIAQTQINISQPSKSASGKIWSSRKFAIRRASFHNLKDATRKRYFPWQSVSIPVILIILKRRQRAFTGLTCSRILDGE